MDYLTFVTSYTMVIVSLCGIVYLSKQFVSLIRWIIKVAMNEWEEDNGKEN